LQSWQGTGGVGVGDRTALGQLGSFPSGRSWSSCVSARTIASRILPFAVFNAPQRATTLMLRMIHTAQVDFVGSGLYAITKHHHALTDRCGGI
jgi:hypothetical protein